MKCAHCNNDLIRTPRRIVFVTVVGIGTGEGVVNRPLCGYKCLIEWAEERENTPPEVIALD